MRVINTMNLKKGHNKKNDKYFMFFFIFTLIILGILLSSYVINNKSPKEKISEKINFDVDQILIKILLRDSGYVTKSIRITNIGKNESYFQLNKKGLEDLVNISDTEFSLKPGQTKIVLLNFSTQKSEEKIVYQPGVYVGKIEVISEGITTVIPIIVEIESRNILFDMNLNLFARDRGIIQGEETTIEVRLFNLQGIAAANVDMEYEVLDLNGNTIITESESVVVQNHVSFFKTIKIPHNLKPGDYIFIAKAKYGSSIGTASYLFEVVAKQGAVKEFGIKEITNYCENDPFCWIILIVWVIIIFSFVIYFYFRIGSWLFYGIGYGFKLILPRRAKKEGLGKEKYRLRIKLIKFKEILYQVDQHLKYKRIKEALEAYTELKEVYRDLIKSSISRKGKRFLYNKISQVYNELSKYRR
jgi:hypothetical protein